METGLRIKKRRVELDMTQDDLAEKMNCGRSAIARVETGKDTISLGRLNKFAKALDCSPLYLLGEDDEEDSSSENKLYTINFGNALREQILSTPDVRFVDMTNNRVLDVLKKKEEKVEKIKRISEKLSDDNLEKVIEYAGKLLIEQI